MPTAPTRSDRVARRNQGIKDAFFTRYTNLPRPKKVSREYVVSQLADEHFLSVATVERIVMPKGT